MVIIARSLQYNKTHMYVKFPMQQILVNGHEFRYTGKGSETQLIRRALSTDSTPVGSQDSVRYNVVPIIYNHALRGVHQTAPCCCKLNSRRLTTDTLLHFLSLFLGKMALRRGANENTIPCQCKSWLTFCSPFVQTSNGYRFGGNRSSTARVDSNQARLETRPDSIQQLRMVELGDLDVSETHPLASELSSLRAAVTRFQA